MTHKPLSILLVEDHPVDAEAVERAFRLAEIPYTIHHARDGVEALAMLRGDGMQRVQRPHLILLDLNMPRMNGLEFLAELRRDKQLKSSVVFVLTSSDDDRDLAAAYDRQVAGYVLKSRTGANFADLTRLLDHYRRVVELPGAAS